MKKTTVLSILFLLICLPTANIIGETHHLDPQRPRLMFKTGLWPAGIDLETVAERVGDPPYERWFERGCSHQLGIDTGSGQRYSRDARPAPA